MSSSMYPDKEAGNTSAGGIEPRAHADLRLSARRGTSRSRDGRVGRVGSSRVNQLFSVTCCGLQFAVCAVSSAADLMLGVREKRCGGVFRDVCVYEMYVCTASATHVCTLYRLLYSRTAVHTRLEVARLVCVDWRLETV